VTWAPERVVLDPNVLDPSGATSIEWYFLPTTDPAAACMASSGARSVTFYVYDVATGQQIHEMILVNGGTAGMVGLGPDDTGFYYTRYPREGSRPEEIWRSMCSSTITPSTSLTTTATSSARRFPASPR
jgi:prolyl oligopeptidase